MMLSTGMSSSRRAILGGSFDPIHLGHLHLMRETEIEAAMEEVILVPNNVSNFKQDQRPVSFFHRRRMLELACLDFHELYPDSRLKLTISDIEGRRKGVSYSSDTVRELLELYKDDHISFIAGDDIPSTLDRWHDWPYLKEHVEFLIFRRGNGERRHPEGTHIRYFESDIFQASSSEVREGRLELLSRRVLEYVRENGLYGVGKKDA